ncbi:hypothetical protein Acr_00g0015870 [Actinidia rufa]|uniref:SWIM-type domain-containing protein n=1 Tax=Actinidia rufa TaxID=165716 RepID=A0A7J0DBB3_9ERIC|nr:hypothetical protein Acr_00g0015870 [Actinidia rufa]
MTTMVMFYWEGKIIRDRREGISYDIDATVCYDVELGTSVAQLRDMIIPRVAEYGEHVSIKFICRYPHRRNGDVMIYKKLPINDDRTLQNVLNIPSRHPDHQHVEIYVVNEEVSTMNTSGSHTAVGWADVHTYGELLSGRGDLSTLGSFTQMLALGQSSRSTLAEEAPGQRMCSLFSQGECIEAGGVSGSVDPVKRLVALGETGTQDNEDADEDPNVGEALHYNPHIPFFTNLVGADDVVGGRDLYDGCPTWSDVTPEFAKGMVFKDKDAVIRACNWYHVKKNKHYHVVETNKNIWSTRCSHDCPWKLRACLKKQHGFFEIKQYPGPHTCLHGMDSLDHRNINSKFIAHLIKTQVTEDPGWKIASIIENVKNHSGFTVFYKKAWLGRTKAIAMVFGDWDSSYEKLPSFMRTLELRNPGTTVILETLDLGTNSESTARAYRALCNEDPRKWTTEVIVGELQPPMIQSATIMQIESALAKGLRYTSKVQAKLEEYQARSAGHHVTICNWASGSAEVVTSVAGTTGNNKHAVYLNPPSCDCEKWMIYHYPCSHMLAVCAKSGRQPWHLIDPKYKIEVYAHVYNTSFEPMVHEHYWAAYDGPKIIPHPSRRRDPTSGRPTKRIHNEMDISRKRQNNHCDLWILYVRRAIDGTVLTLQAHHRSTRIWEHGGTDALACRRCGSGLYDVELDPRVLQYVLRAGLPIDGAPITHSQAFVTVQECQDICMQAFGVIPPAEEIDSGRLRMSWLRHTFDILPEHADDVSVQRHARAYILQLIGGLLLTGYSQTLVRVAYLPFLLDLDAARACSWGSAVLAMLYRSLCRATKIGQRQIAGGLLLLQIWACERFPRMCPHRVDDHIAGQQPLLIRGVHFPGGPWGARWRFRFRTTTTSTHVVRVYRDQLDRLRPDEVVEWHLPDQVCRQFGLRQVVPEAPNTSPALHGIDMRGRARTDWTQFHREHIDQWHHRLEYLVVGVIDDTAMRYDDPYMVWYRRITRTLVGNPAHRRPVDTLRLAPRSRLRLTRYIAVIHDRINRAIYAYDQPESLQDLYDTRDMCSRSLHALHEHQRIGQPRVPDPTTTMTPGFPSTSSSQQFTQYVGATQTSASYVTPTMPSYTYHMSSHDMPSSSRPSSSGVRPRRTTHRHITSPVTYDQSSSFLPVGDEEEFDGYVDPLLESGRQIEITCLSRGGFTDHTQSHSDGYNQKCKPEPQPGMQPYRLGTLTHVFSRRPRPSRDRRPPRCAILYSCGATAVVTADLCTHETIGIFIFRPSPEEGISFDQPSFLAIGKRTRSLLRPSELERFAFPEPEVNCNLNLRASLRSEPRRARDSITAPIGQKVAKQYVPQQPRLAGGKKPALLSPLCLALGLVEPYPLATVEWPPAWDGPTTLASLPRMLSKNAFGNLSYRAARTSIQKHVEVRANSAPKPLISHNTSRAKLDASMSDRHTTPIPAVRFRVIPLRILKPAVRSLVQVLEAPPAEAAENLPAFPSSYVRACVLLIQQPELTDRAGRGKGKQQTEELTDRRKESVFINRRAEEQGGGNKKKKKESLTAELKNYGRAVYGNPATAENDLSPLSISPKNKVSMLGR